MENDFAVGNSKWYVGKRSPSWEVPFKVIRVVSGNAYIMEDLEGYSLPKALNGKYLKCYYSSTWQD
jgi:hypothetical protein